MSLITALDILAKQVGIARIVKGVAIPHPVGDPSLPAERDRALRRDLVVTALKALETEVTGTTVFEAGSRRITSTH